MLHPSAYDLKLLGQTFDIRQNRSSSKSLAGSALLFGFAWRRLAVCSRNVAIYIDQHEEQFYYYINSFKLSLYQLKKDLIDSTTWIKFTPIFIAARGK